VSGHGALLAEAVELLPLGPLPKPTVLALTARLSRRIELPVRPLPPAEPGAAKLAGREQLDASALLAGLEARAKPPASLLVGVTGHDIAIPIFTFVFGLARQGGTACVVSLARADPCFYGLPQDSERCQIRAVAEILHELGHLATLAHCADHACLMSFAGTVEKVDTRGSRFCAACAARLPRWLRGHPPPVEAY